MKQIEIPHCEEVIRRSDLRDISAYLDSLEYKSIDAQPWPEYSYKPEAAFAISHSGDCIFIKFNVVEKFLRAANRVNNSPVNQDSCVEFFISFDGNTYYNFEFNCIATCKVGFGPKDRSMRRYLPDDLIDSINRQALIKTGDRYKDGLIAWELTVSIPAEVFHNCQILSLKGLKATANFYKCGDLLQDPHFLAWNEVKAPKPNFHLPEFFGAANFL